jgi:hypothetical protein
MRWYIASRTNGPTRPRYEFAARIEGALLWQEKEKEWVHRYCLAMSQEPITIDPPFGDGVTCCTDFRVESRPEGGLVVSCEAPIFAS